MMFRTYPAPHIKESIPRNCWTCKNHTIVLSGMTTCDRIPDYTHSKVGIEPCEDYTLNEVWQNVDWTYVRGDAE